LLTHFGSLEGVRRATPEQLAAVAGIGEELAEQIRGSMAIEPPERD
jgi:excinuclease UvrABC nuclease subunit